VVKRALEGLDGVEKAEVSFAKGTAQVRFDPSKVTVEDMIRAVEKAGFKGSVLRAP
jgi:Cu+-exporting ATPase